MISLVFPAGPCAITNPVSWSHTEGWTRRVRRPPILHGKMQHSSGFSVLRSQGPTCMSDPKLFLSIDLLGGNMNHQNGHEPAPLRRKMLSCCTVMGYHSPEALRGVPCTDQAECTAPPTPPACLSMWRTCLRIPTSCPDSVYHRGLHYVCHPVFCLFLPPWGPCNPAAL